MENYENKLLEGTKKLVRDLIKNCGTKESINEYLEQAKSCYCIADIFTHDVLRWSDDKLPIVYDDIQSAREDAIMNDFSGNYDVVITEFDAIMMLNKAEYEKKYGFERGDYHFKLNNNGSIEIRAMFGNEIAVLPSCSNVIVLKQA